MPDLFYPALGCLLIGDVLMVIALIRPYEEQKILARDEQTRVVRPIRYRVRPSDD